MKLCRAGMLAGCCWAALGAGIANAAAGNTEAGDLSASKSATIEEVIVTAERREESVQRTPISVTAVTAETLEKKNVQTVEQLTQLVPTMHYNDTIGQTFIGIRGVGGEPNTTVGGDPSVAFNIDGVYIARPASVSAAFFDVERIEVLRGPQGTLYGRNSTGGAINIVTRAPQYDSLRGTADLLVGDYGRFRGRAALNLPLIEDRLAIRISAIREKHDGYLKNLFYPSGKEDLNDLDMNALRVQVGARLTENVELVLRGDDFRRQGNGPGREVEGPYALNAAITAPAPFGYGAKPNPNEPFVTSQNTPNSMVVRDGGGSAELRAHDLNVPLLGQVGLTVVGAARQLHYASFSDNDLSGANFTTTRIRQLSRQDSVEARLASEGSGNLQWIAGLYHFQEYGKSTVRFDGFLPNGATLLVAQPGLNVRAESNAVFGQANWSATSRLRLTGGLRYTEDDKKALQSVPAGPTNLLAQSNSHWSALTGKAVADYQVAENRMVYASISRGYKAGGYSLDGPAFDPEKIWAYEIGTKNQFFEGRLQLNLAAFYYDQKDLQVSLTGVGRTGIPTVVTENAGAATSKGVELEFQAAPIAELRLSGSVAYLDAKFGDYRSVDSLNAAAGVQQLNGKVVEFAPKFTLMFNGDYTVKLGTMGEVEPGFTWRWVDKQTLRPFARGPGDLQAEYSTLDLRVTYRPSQGRWNIQAFVENATDKAYKESSAANGITRDAQVTYGTPRTYGAKLQVDF